MALLIEFNGDTGLNFYAFLFHQKVKDWAFNPSTSDFAEFSISSQNIFVIPLTEGEERTGYYSASISNVRNIDATEDSLFYLIEVFEATGTGSGSGTSSITYNRLEDTFSGSKQFYWDGNKEVDICGCRSNSDVDDISDAVWTRKERTLTEELVCPELPCPDHEEELQKIQDQLDEILEKIGDCGQNPQRGLPDTQTPRFGAPGSTAGNSGITFSGGDNG